MLNITRSRDHEMLPYHRAGGIKTFDHKAIMSRIMKLRHLSVVAEAAAPPCTNNPTESIHIP